MQRFLQHFALLVAGTLSGFDRLVFKGRLCPLYYPGGMDRLLRSNQVAHQEFKRYAAEVTARVVQAAGVPEVKAQGCYRYLNSSNIDKEEVTREFAAKQRPGKTGRVCVLQCIEPCWTFDWSTTNGISTIHGEPGTCITTTNTRPSAGSTSACRPGSPLKSRSASTVENGSPDK